MWKSTTDRDRTLQPAELRRIVNQELDQDRINEGKRSDARNAEWDRIDKLDNQQDRLADREWIDKWELSVNHDNELRADEKERLIDRADSYKQRQRL